MDIATIGFTRTSAHDFFERLKAAGLPLLVDVRRHNTSQLAGFAKRDDLAYFLREVCGMDYREEPLLAPEEDALRDYRSKAHDWEQYAKRYLAALHERGIPDAVGYLRDGPGVVFLCSEASAEHCHRRLVAEFLAERWGDVRIRHL